MFQEKRNFKNKKGLTLSAVFTGEDTKAPVVILCHGYSSGKEGVSNTDMTKKLLEVGISIYNFDFTAWGESEGKQSDTTPLQGLDDLESAAKDLGVEEFALYGSSYGGWVSILYASKNPVLALGLKCPVSDWSHRSLLQSTDTQYIHDIPGLDEAKKYNLYELAKNIKAPTLIVHGSDDEIVPLAQSQKLLESLSREKELSIIHKGSHTMRGPTMEDAHTQLTEFFRNKLL